MTKPSGSSIGEKALNKLPENLFWIGFGKEALEYLTAYPEETAERASFAGTSADGLSR